MHEDLRKDLAAAVRGHDRALPGTIPKRKVAVWPREGLQIFRSLTLLQLFQEGGVPVVGCLVVLLIIGRCGAAMMYRRALSTDSPCTVGFLKFGKMQTSLREIQEVQTAPQSEDDTDGSVLNKPTHWPQAHCARPVPDRRRSTAAARPPVLASADHVPAAVLDFAQGYHAARARRAQGLPAPSRIRRVRF